MKIRFWGTRGSIAKPGPDTVRYGGNTSCVEVVSDRGTRLLLDCGTGAHALGQKLVREQQHQRGHILISHTHWDHIQGIPFFAPLFTAGARWDFYAAKGFGESLREVLAGQMEYTYFPVTLDAFQAELKYHHLREGRIEIDDISVYTHYLNHPALTLGFRIEADGAAVVYACDHEPHHRECAHGDAPLTGEDQVHAEFLRDADLVIHDAQYTAEEYASKAGWGHSTVEYAVEACRHVGVKRLALTHHDPLRVDDAVDSMLSKLLLRYPEQARNGLEIFAAAEGMELQLRTERRRQPRADDDRHAAIREDAEVLESRVLLALTAEEERGKRLRQAAQADQLEVRVASSREQALKHLQQTAVGLLICDDPFQGDPASAVIENLARQLEPNELAFRRVGWAARTRSKTPSHGLDGRLEDPFSDEYLRSRVRAWLLRSSCDWSLPRRADDESDRLAALHALRLLDTPREERFDRYTRLAAGVTDTPVALISLVDDDRQWFKSCFGFDIEETSREISFCAHAILQRELFVVPDTLLDSRFADNPVVCGEPRVRFYAGQPLVLPSGHCVGTLCVVDVRPRLLDDKQTALLKDLAELVVKEALNAKVAA
ncbi:MBL fold metallo-hydrolase [Pseudomarimonas arenosa]|uniref:GAF domain-containing protein n=1 Tax=Pseudomarimonas arenosa TaxID=2774145 RepID=A0AAW3ZSA0_9GAMM|nr:MBL fold metallo-hydrolase [Pseudomarimonas arenosa]MBD8527106.1 GAF domain-containing protein [Pseudomarimonas arenosa]